MKKQVCYTDLSLCDVIGIGGDPFYKRVKEFDTIFKRLLPDDIRKRITMPQLGYTGKKLEWLLDDKDIAIDYLQSLLQIRTTNPELYQQLQKDKAQLLSAIDAIYQQADGQAKAYLECLLSCNKSINQQYSDSFFVSDSKQVCLAVWGINLLPHNPVNMVISHPHTDDRVYSIQFDANIQSVFSQQPHIIKRRHGYVLSEKDIPAIHIPDKYENGKWEPHPPEIHGAVVSDISFKYVLQPKPVVHTISFDSNVQGVFAEQPLVINIKDGETLTSDIIPDITIPEGYSGGEWEPYAPASHGAVTEDLAFRYCLQPIAVPPIVEPEEDANNGIKQPLPEEPLPEEPEQPHSKFDWSKLWKWLLWILLALLILWLLICLLRSCDDDHHTDKTTIIEDTHIDDPYGEDTYIQDPHTDNPYVGDPYTEPISPTRPAPVTDEGSIRALPIRTPRVAPIAESDGNSAVIMPPITSMPTPPGLPPEIELPEIIANRLNIFFESEDADLKQWMLEFKNIYPADDYAILGWDDNVKLIQIRIPEEEREQIRKVLPNQIKSQKFFIVDETVIRSSGDISKKPKLNRGWHLQAVHLQQAWQYTQGDTSVIIAIVDDGADINHSMLVGRIHKPYNIFTQSNKINKGSGHGTHVAALAAGSGDGYSNGVAGVAPNCRLMPIQIFDGDYTTFSAMVAGVMYAVFHGADVINLSLGKGLPTGIPEEWQEFISDNLFKEEERLWKRIMRIAEERNILFVFATGNSHLLSKTDPHNRYPAHTLNVVSCDDKKRLSKFSNYAEGSSIAAPGEDIYSAVNNNRYDTMDGTSMAAPIVSGAAALLKSVDDKLSNQDVIALLRGTGSSTNDAHAPFLQIDKALAKLLGEFPADDFEDDNARRQAIREEIERLKKRISELEKQL